MAPNTADATVNITKTNSEERDYYKGFKHEGYKTIFGTYVTELKWFNIFIVLGLHALFFKYVFTAPYSNYLSLIPYGLFVGIMSAFGITPGAHRLWCHRTYKAKLPLRIFLLLCFSISGQNPLFEWVRDHRVHHKFSETDADPHNSKRGFFFAHLGWLMMKKHPEVLRRGREVDMSDMLADPLVTFHRKYFIPMNLMMCFVIPGSIPYLFWGCDFFWPWMGITLLRWFIILHCSSLVNSAAHFYGSKPYDKTIGPTENYSVILVSLGEGWYLVVTLCFIFISRNINPVENVTVSIISFGEGWHNYHHTFPWDYRAGELGKYNLTAFCIDCFAKMGWAYDLKTPSKDLVRRTVEKSGDGTHLYWRHTEIPKSGEKDFIIDEDNDYSKKN